MVTSGHSVVFISHKLDEVLAIANRITVLQHGRVTAAGLPAQGVTKRELAQLMVGREIVFTLQKPPAQPGPVVLDLRNVCAENDRGLPALKGLALQVRASEIVGVAGVAGNGQSELAQVITGLRKCTCGQVLINGEDIVNRPPPSRVASRTSPKTVPASAARPASAWPTT